MTLLPHLVNPNLSLPLFLLGLFLLYLDFNIPGKVVPAALGTFCCSLALYGLLHTRLAPWAIALTFLSLGIVLLDLAYPARNLLAMLGTGFLAYALFELTAQPNAVHPVHPVTAILVATAFTVVTLKLGRIALLARRNKAITPNHRPAR